MSAIRVRCRKPALRTTHSRNFHQVKGFSTLSLSHTHTSGAETKHFTNFSPSFPTRLHRVLFIIFPNYLFDSVVIFSWSSRACFSAARNHISPSLNISTRRPRRTVRAINRPDSTSTKRANFRRRTRLGSPTYTWSRGERCVRFRFRLNCESALKDGVRFP